MGDKPNNGYRAGANGPVWFVVLLTILSFPLAVVFTIVLVAWRWAKREIANNERVF